jgi:hypothetical protein
MKNYILYLSLIVVSMNSCDIRKTDETKRPKSASLPTFKEHTTVEIIDSVYDFGKIKEGEMVEYKYRFKNTGKAPLVIVEALASCGCTVPEKPEKPIPSGEIGYLKVKFNSDKKPGEAHKTITITSNAEPEFPTLLLKGTVIGKD